MTRRFLAGVFEVASLPPIDDEDAVSFLASVVAAEAAFGVFDTF